VHYLKLPNGIPSRDCISRLLTRLKPESFQACFREWIASIASAVTDTTSSPVKRLIAIDGKTCRGSHDKNKGLGALHVVSAWASEEGLALGQVATEEKSNEITAIPVLLKQLSLADAIVTIDAMGCQKEIVDQIVEDHGVAVIAVKGNQPKLHEAIKTHFREHLEKDFEEMTYRCHETEEKGHGRNEQHNYFLSKVDKDWPLAKDWPKVKAIGYAGRYSIDKDGNDVFEIRYYISTRYLSGKRFAEAVRGHWGIESMHWSLDVTFCEDDHRARERSLVNNLSWLRRFAISLLKQRDDKDSMKGRMLQCAYNTNILAEVLGLQQI
jgi:predicted transposase YbfD/YdcC